MERIPVIDGLKTIAFIFVFISHIPRIGFVYNPYGVAGVTLFFVISGYLAYYNNGLTPAARMRGGVFQLRKFLHKCYSLHLITFIAVAVMQMFWLQRWFSVSGYWNAIKCAVPNLMLIHSFIPDGAYYYGFNSVSWYLSDLAFMYFLLPFLIRIINRFRNRINLFIIALFGICYLIWDIILYKIGVMTGINIQWLLYILPITRLFDFIIGMMIACVRVRDEKKIERKEIQNPKTGLSYLGIILFLGALYISKWIPQWLSMSIVYMPGVILVMYILTEKSIKKMFINRLLSWKGFSYITAISMELYLSHQVVIGYVEYYCNDIGRLSDIEYYTVITVVLLIISVFLKLLLTPVKNKAENMVLRR